MDEAILCLNKSAMVRASQTTSTIPDTLDLRLLPITAALSSLETKVLALSATVLTTAPDDLTMAPPPGLSLVIDKTSPPPHAASAFMAPTGSRFFPNVDPSKLFVQGDA